MVSSRVLPVGRGRRSIARGLSNPVGRVEEKLEERCADELITLTVLRLDHEFFLFSDSRHTTSREM